MSERSRRIRASRKRKRLIANIPNKARRARAYHLNATLQIAKHPGHHVFQDGTGPRPVIPICAAARARINNGILLVPRSAL